MSSNEAAAERLGLDPNDLIRIARAGEHYAEALIVDSPDTSGRVYERRLVRASVLAEVASCYALTTDAKRTRSSFRAAAAAYTEIGHPYATICAIASGGSTEHEIMQTPDGDPAAEALAAAYLFAGSRMRGDEGDVHTFWREPFPVPSMPVGELHIPVGLFDRLATVSSNADRSWADARDGVVRIAERASERLQLAMEDSFHWRSVQSELLPVEPELVAVGVVASRLGTPRELERLSRDLQASAAGVGIAIGVNIAARPELT